MHFECLVFGNSKLLEMVQIKNAIRIVKYADSVSIPSAQGALRIRYIYLHPRIILGIVDVVVRSGIDHNMGYFTMIYFIETGCSHT